MKEQEQKHQRKDTTAHYVHRMSGGVKKTQKGQSHQKNEDEQDSKYYDDEGRTLCRCTACKCNGISPFQWRPHIKTET